MLEMYYIDFQYGTTTICISVVNEESLTTT